LPVEATREPMEPATTPARTSPHDARCHQPGTDICTVMVGEYNGTRFIQRPSQQFGVLCPARMVVSPHHGRAPFGVTRFGFWRKNSKSILPVSIPLLKQWPVLKGASGLIGTCRAPLLFPIGTSSLEPFLSTSRSSNSGTIIGAGILRGRRPAGCGLIRLCHRHGAQARMVPGKRVPR
jgi:hypothetical protein